MPTRKVREIMSAPAVTIEVTTPLSEAADRMLENSFGCLPVVDANGAVVGILTETDLTAKEASVPWAAMKAPKLFNEWLGEAGVEKVYAKARDTPVEAIMTKPAVTIDADETVDQAVSLMIEHEIKHLPVCEGARVVGVVTRHDVLRLLLKR